jgi:hypothetical protein
MIYRVFEGRLLELLYKTDARLTPQLVAFRVGCSIADAQGYLEQMAGQGTLAIENDDVGNVYYDLPGRPAPTGEPLSWKAGAAPEDPAAPSAATPSRALVRAIPHGHPVILVAPHKSVGLAVALAAMFGPIGMLYSTVPGSFIMFFGSFVLAMATMGLSLLVTLPLGMVWAGMAAHEHNQRIRRLAGAPSAVLLRE